MNNARLDLKRTPERVELIRQMADSNDRAKALAAQVSFAKAVAPAVQYVLNQKVTSNAIYTDLAFSKNDRPTIPLDAFLGTKEKHIRVWSQNNPGGLATNLIQGLGEYTFSIYRLDSAVSWDNDYIRNSQLPVIANGLDRMINEMAVQQERNAWSPLLAAAAGANDGANVLSSTVAGVFQLEDFNKIQVRLDRQYTSYAGGTPEGATPVGLTDLFVSPEIVGQIRGWAYNPMNVRGGYTSNGTEVGGVVALPDSIREQVFRQGGLLNIFDVNIHKLIEFGKNAKYNKIFDTYYLGSFNPATQEVLFGVDLSRNVILRPVVTDDDFGGGSVIVRPDDQFFARSEKTGFYAVVQEGRAILDDRAFLSMIV